MNKKIYLLTLGCISFGALASNGIGNPEQRGVWIFKNGMSNSEVDVPNYACYRIPAIVKLNNGELLAFSEARQNSCSDHDKNIDIVMRKRDLSGNWGPVTIVADHGGKVTRNPAPVVDDQGRIHLVYNVNYDANNPDSEAAISESLINQDNNRYRASVYYIRSSDNGESWTDYSATPRNIDATVHPYSDKKTYQDGLWSWYAMTPGHALKLKNGNLFFPANHAEYKHGLPDGISRYYSHAITLDPKNDLFLLNATVGPDTNEVMAEQLDNGWLYMNMRNNHRSIGAFRAVTYSKDGGENWMGTEYDHIPKTGSSNFWRDIGYDSTLISPRVQSSILRYSSDKDETGVSRLLFSNPADTSVRKNGTLRISYDEGKSWIHGFQYESEASQYSDLVVNRNNSIGILYEKGSIAHDGIYYLETNLEMITGSKDAYIPTVVSQNYSDGRIPSVNLISEPHQSTLDPQGDDITVAITFELSADVDTKKTQFLARKGNALSRDAGWGLFIENGNIIFRTADDNKRYGVKATLPSPLGVGKHTVTVYIKSSVDDHERTMRMFFDGEQMTTTPIYEALPLGSVIATNNPLVIAGSDNHHPLNGKIFGYQVYDISLRDETIRNYAISYLKGYDFSSFFNNPENNNFELFFKD